MRANHTVRQIGLSGWYTIEVVRYIAQNGELVCTDCYHDKWSTEKRQTCTPVLADSKPHCDEPCDICHKEG